MTFQDLQLLPQLLRAVESGTEPEISARDNIATIACVEACYRSIAEKLLTPECCIVPLEVRLSRPIYYVTLRELMDVPAVRSFTEFVRTYHF